MSFEKFQQLGYELTEAEVLRLERQILQQYRDAIKNIRNELDRTWGKYLTNVNPDNYYNEMLKYNRLDNLLKSVTREYNVKSAKAGRLTGQALELAFSNHYYRREYAASWISDVKFTVVSPDLIDLSVYGTTDSWKKIAALPKFKASDYKAPYATLSELLQKNRQAELLQLRDSITQGLVQGKSSTKTAKSIVDVIGRAAIQDGQISSSGAMSNAMRIVRTETNRVMNDSAFALANDLLSQGIDVQKQWSATLDSGTRPVHASLDGQIVPIDEPFESSEGDVMRPGQFDSVGQNVNCRCNVVDVIDGQSPTLRRGRNPVSGKNEVFEYKDFKKWADDNGLKENKYGQLYR